MNNSTPESTSDNHQSPLESALERWERAVATPLVPGELKKWLAAIDETLKSVSNEFDQAVQAEHEPVFQEITTDDPGLFARVKSLRETDGRNAIQLNELRERLDSLKSECDAAGADEAAVIGSVKSFVADSQQHIIDLRQQETAIRTWRLESVMRDRGRVD